MSDAPRKLATIVALDVAGYSARTEEDEAKSTAEVAGLRGVIEAVAKAHAGRIFNTAGDGFMLEFASSLAAVEAAYELAERCEPKVRVGVHVGDVIVQQNGDLLGHGVNVAARLMAQSAPGAVLVSVDVRRMIRGPILDRFVSRGPLQLDKMAETIEAFALIAAASAALAPAQPKSAEPLLAVLAFDNLSNDPEMQFFSDGVSEEIHYVLTRGAGLGVIGRTSAFQFRGADKKNAARELKATHILDGAVRKAGSRMRVNAELTEVASGRSLWADRYDRDIADALALQDEIASEVSAALKTFLPPRDGTSAVDPAAYELFLRAQRLFSDVTIGEAQHAEALLERVVSSSPNFARAWALLAIAKVSRLPNDHHAISEPLYAAAMAAAQKALAIDPNCAGAFQALTGLKPGFSEHGEKLQLIERAVALAPTPWILCAYGGALVSIGRCREAMPHLARAATLEPLVPFFATAAATTMCSIGRIAEAIDMIEVARRRMPDSPILWSFHWQILLVSGQLGDARKMSAIKASIPAGMPPSDVNRALGIATLSQSPLPQRETFLRAVLDPVQNPSLPIEGTVLAAHLDCADLAFEQLFAAIDSHRPVGTNLLTRGINRSNITIPLFGFMAGRMRSDVRFPRLCARMGLVDYWRASGRWPDCATEVPYDFKAECEKALREVK